MKIIEATIIDQTHLELSRPIDAEPGDIIQISIADMPGDSHLVWEKELAAMANDPDIQRELSLIRSEFADTESDGLENQ